MTTTLYIVPAWSDQASQCRICAFDGYNPMRVSDHYKTHPQLWREVGIMNSRGELVCFDGPAHQRQELLDCQPLMAGLVLTFDKHGAAE